MMELPVSRRLTVVRPGGKPSPYDAFGNLSKHLISGDSGLSWLPGYNNNNQYTLTGVTYDPDGNLTNDTFHTYSWSAFGEMTSIDSGTITHDAFGRSVEYANGSTIRQFLYGPGFGSREIARMNGQTLDTAHIPLTGGGLAEYHASGLDDYVHVDWLGSSRFSSNPNRTENWDLAQAPFGEVYAGSVIGSGTMFTEGQQAEFADNKIYNFPYRGYYTSQGRWMSPDPAGLAAVNPTNPQTWNRYAYVGGNPLSNVDPSGLDGDRVPLNIAPPTGGAGGVNPASQANLAGLGATYEINGMQVSAMAFNDSVLGQGGMASNSLLIRRAESVPRALTILGQLVTGVLG